MILTTILILIALIAAIVGIITLVAGGVGFIVVFGDIIVCVLFIVWIVKKLLKKKK